MVSTALFVSDVHLEDPSDPKYLRFLHFLSNEAPKFSQVYILGDLFDVWPGTNRYQLNRHPQLFQAFQGLTSQGIKLTYVEGNHDFHLGKHFTDVLGVHVITDTVEVQLGDRRVLLAHGDLGNPEEIGYRLLRRVLRSRLVKALLTVVPGFLVYHLGKLSSSTSRNLQSYAPEKLERVKAIYRATASSLLAKGYDVVIMGHTHIPDDYRTDAHGRPGRYLNTGDWVHNYTYLEFDGEDFYTKTFPIHSNS